MSHVPQQEEDAELPERGVSPVGFEEEGASNESATVKVVKVGKSSWPRETKIYVNDEMIRWESRRKKRAKASIPLGSVTRVMHGQVSKNFTRVNSSMWFKSLDADEKLRAQSITFVFDGVRAR